MKEGDLGVDCAFIYAFFWRGYFALFSLSKMCFFEMFFSHSEMVMFFLCLCIVLACKYLFIYLFFFGHQLMIFLASS